MNKKIPLLITVAIIIIAMLVAIIWQIRAIRLLQEELSSLTEFITTEEIPLNEEFELLPQD